jgi:hypothetical protein
VTWVTQCSMPAAVDRSRRRADPEIGTLTQPKVGPVIADSDRTRVGPVPGRSNRPLQIKRFAICRYVWTEELEAGYIAPLRELLLHGPDVRISALQYVTRHYTI